MTFQFEDPIHCL